MESEREVVARALCKHDKRDPDDRGPYECPAWKAYEDDAGIAIAALDALRAAPGDVEAMADWLAGAVQEGGEEWDAWQQLARHVLQRITAAVAAERERCAQECDQIARRIGAQDDKQWTASAECCAAAIRAGTPGHE